MEQVINSFKALSDETRLRIVGLLKGAGIRLCVCEIMDALDVSHYNISRHLKILKNAGLTGEKRDGRWVYHSLSPPADPFQKVILEMVAVIPEESLAADRTRLEMRLAMREGEKCVIGIDSEEWYEVLDQLDEFEGNRQHVQKTDQKKKAKRSIG